METQEYTTINIYSKWRFVENKYNATIYYMMFYHYICTVFTMYEN